MMTAKSEWNRYGEELETLLRLQTSPIAVRMLKTEGRYPQGGIKTQEGP